MRSQPLIGDPKRTFSPNFIKKSKTSHSGHTQKNPLFESYDSVFDDDLSIWSKETHFSSSSSFEKLADDSDNDSIYSGEKHEDQYTVLNSALAMKKKAVPDDTKYKTELCKKWSETGQCPYGKKCRFAHGKHELNEKLNLNKARYKSKQCNSFHTTMVCPYGIRCLFAHENRPLRELTETKLYGKYLFCPDLLEKLPRNKNRLPAFAKNTKNTSSSLTSSKTTTSFTSFNTDMKEPNFFISAFKSQNYFMLSLDD